MPGIRIPDPPVSLNTVMMIAGEASGDAHGAKLVRAMAEKNPRLSFVGIGGERMAAAGADIRVNASELSVVGITEVITKARNIVRAMSTAKQLLRQRPGLLILIDYPDFNLHVAAYAKKRGIPVLYYISPQIWAWRSGRVHKIGRRIDHMAVILPFEEAFYRRHNIPATFVGHPLMDGVPGDALNDPEALKPEEYARRLDNTPVIGLLPGSREGEVERLLPVMLDAAEILTRRHPGMRFLLSRSSSVSPAQLSAIISAGRRRLDLEVVSGGLEDVYLRSTLVVAASGTVTLETAIAGIPMVVIYKVSPVSYRLGRALIRVNHIGLVNLIAERRLVPELVQDDASPEGIAGTVTGLLSDAEGLLRMRAALLDLRKRLGRSGASDRTAEIALGLLAADSGRPAS
jgi:lipid-A-disaccharide synthase